MTMWTLSLDVLNILCFKLNLGVLLSLLNEAHLQIEMYESKVYNNCSCTFLSSSSSESLGQEFCYRIPNWVLSEISYHISLLRTPASTAVSMVPDHLAQSSGKSRQAQQRGHPLGSGFKVRACIPPLPRWVSASALNLHKPPGRA